jgi:hypothetical protein
MLLSRLASDHDPPISSSRVIESAGMPHHSSCYVTFSLPAYTWWENSLWPVDRVRKYSFCFTDGFHITYEHQLKADDRNSKTLLWNIPKGQRWTEIFLVSKILCSAPGYVLCLVEMTRHVIIYHSVFIINGLACRVKDLKSILPENWWQKILKRYEARPLWIGNNLKIFALHLNTHQRAYKERRI